MSRPPNLVSSTIPLGDGITRVKREKTSSRKNSAIKEGKKKGDADPRFREIREQKRLGGSEGSRTRKRIIQMMDALGGHTTECSTTLLYRIFLLLSPRVIDVANGKA